MERGGSAKITLLPCRLHVYGSTCAVTFEGLGFDLKRQPIPWQLQAQLKAGTADALQKAVPALSPVQVTLRV